MIARTLTECGVVIIASFLFACGTSPADKDGGADVALQPLDGSPSECSDQAKRVYLVSTQNDLWSFDPGTLAFQKIGALDCPTTSTPESLGVDRTAPVTHARSPERVTAGSSAFSRT